MYTYLQLQNYILISLIYLTKQKLFMDKLSQSYFKNVTPVKSQSPDLKPPHRIQPTTSPYHQNQLSYHQSSSTPTNRLFQSKTTANQQRDTTAQRYFKSNKPKSKLNQTAHITISHSNRKNNFPYSNNVCRCSDSCHSGSEEIVSELRKLIGMINGTKQTIVSLQPESSEIKKQIDLLQKQNQHLLYLMNNLQIKSQQKYQHAYEKLEEQNHELRCQIQELEGKQMEIERTYKIINSQIRQKQLKNQLIQKQNQGLRYLLNTKKQEEQEREQQLKKQLQQQALVITRLKDQYSESLHSLKGQLIYEIEQKEKKLQNKNMDFRHKISILEGRIKKLQGLSEKEYRKLDEQNKSLHLHLEQNSMNISKISQEYQRQIVKLENKLKNRDEVNRQNQILREQMENLRKQHNSSKNQINSLKIQINKFSDATKEAHMYEQRLRSHERYNIQLQDKNKRLQEELNNIWGTVQNLKLLQSDNARLSEEIRKVNQQLMIFSKLKEENQQEMERMRKKIVCLQEQSEKIKNAPVIVQDNREQIEERDAKIYDLELTIRNINMIMEDTETKIKKYEENGRRLSIQLDKLKTAREKDRIQNQKILLQTQQMYKSRIQQLQTSYSNQKNMLILNLQQAEEKEKELMSRMTTHLSQIRHPPIKEQLMEIKKLVDEGNLDGLQCKISRISEQYSHEILKSEQKTIQIDGLIKQKCFLEDQIADKDKLRLILEEKINILEGNIRILDGELKERKILCESLLNQKTLMEKEVIMLKKVNLDKQGIEATKAKAKQISQRIGKLIEMEDGKGKKISYITTKSTHVTGNQDY